jgi:phosphate transport system substrate-binding protein
MPGAREALLEAASAHALLGGRRTRLSGARQAGVWFKKYILAQHRRSQIMRSLVARVLVLAGLLGALGCGRKPASGLTLAGSTSIQPFAEKWAETFRAKHPDVDIHVQGGGSTAGVKAAVTGAAHIGMVSRELHADEAAQLKQFQVARDGLAIIVHPSNPVNTLAPEQVQRIYVGEITNWKQVGGPDAPMTVITREEGSGTRGAFEELLMGKEKKISSSALVQDSTGAVRQMVSSNPGAIGYISLGLVDSSVKAVRLDGVEPSEANIDAGKYPLVRPFLFVTKGEPTGLAREFIDWITGPEGQALTRREGLLPPKK